MPSAIRAWTGHGGSVAERQRLTDAIVRRLPTPEQGKHITPDSEVAGFGVRITANGARSYVLRYTTRAGRERTYTIGDATVWRTTDARDKARELRREIETAVNKLPEEQRLTFVLREYEGLSYTEIAEVLGCSQGTVKSRLSRAKDTLRSLMRKYVS